MFSHWPGFMDFVQLLGKIVLQPPAPFSAGYGALSKFLMRPTPLAYNIYYEVMCAFQFMYLHKFVCSHNLCVRIIYVFA